MPTFIRFGDDHYIAVIEEMAELRRRMETAAAKRPPCFEVTRTDGAEMIVNAELIRTMTEGKKDGGGG